MRKLYGATLLFKSYYMLSETSETDCHCVYNQRVSCGLFKLHDYQWPGECVRLLHCGMLPPTKVVTREFHLSRGMAMNREILTFAVTVICKII